MDGLDTMRRTHEQSEEREAASEQVEVNTRVSAPPPFDSSCPKHSSRWLEGEKKKVCEEEF